MSDIVSRLTYALGHHHWGRTGLLEEARAEILRLRQENSTLASELEQLSPEDDAYRGRHSYSLTLTDVLMEMRA